ncbi:adenosylcobinamide-GDP ribazoletransferase [Denitrobaculum tricleocarpae]|uniref:Adenosylcobinamide-GDP ribazoletransferase n=1 Tax=Denitrobaculum tricleocarpae TaxID=2591009 RepID=A0A545TGI7_9PROT|nr:adenosylcobinamide-GDP ribazoletransferase [Denitrobaculum tricleocarpae]TQV76325.1 adenosylcobinamide-GDP ribazoletransferase [Denitrobaculum tricleocarpae]
MSKDDREELPSRGHLWSDLKFCLVFMTRLPLRLDDRTRNRSLAEACAVLPLVGVVVGLWSAAVLWLTLAAGLPYLAAAATAVAASILLTGALHEDGLADVADGFGGGLEKARKLEIMRDSRIGSYGVIAIGLSLILRVTLIAEIVGRFESFWGITGALIAVHVIGRGLLPAVMAALPLARGDGLAAAAERPSGSRAGAASALSLLAAAFCLGLTPGIVAFVAGGIAVIIMAWLARRQIGGYTGDVLGASEQVAEIATLAAITAML